MGNYNICFDWTAHHGCELPPPVPVFCIISSPSYHPPELGPEHEDHGGGCAELGPQEPQEVLHVGPAVGEEQDAGVKQLNLTGDYWDTHWMAAIRQLTRAML